MNSEPLTSEELYGGSVRYVPTQFIFIPFEDDFLIYTSYGVHRTYRGRYTIAELADFLRSDFAHQLELDENRKRREEQQRQSSPSLELNLELKL